jgi:hypothetical protein
MPCTTCRLGLLTSFCHAISLTPDMRSGLCILLSWTAFILIYPAMCLTPYLQYPVLDCIEGKTWPLTTPEEGAKGMWTGIITFGLEKVP